MYSKFRVSLKIKKKKTPLFRHFVDNFKSAKI